MTSETVPPFRSSPTQYIRVFGTFFRNSAVREMSFRGNFLITVLTRTFYFAAQLTLFEIIYRNVDSIRDWSRAEYFGFMATALLVNSVVETLFMPNCSNFSELIRTGNLDFVLLKPIDPQFLVSCEKVAFPMLTQGALALVLLGYSIQTAAISVTATQVALYLLGVGCAVVFFYSLMIALASTSIWFGRNQGLYDFWFYVTVFARYPREIYTGSPVGDLLRVSFTYVLPILVVVTVPARVLLGKSLQPNWIWIIVPVTAVCAFVVSRRVFFFALRSYRSASS